MKAIGSLLLAIVVNVIGTLMVAVIGIGIVGILIYCALWAAIVHSGYAVARWPELVLLLLVALLYIAGVPAS